MRFKNRFQRFMNHRAPANGRYKPTCYEHAANCYTHAFLIVPAIVGSALLHRLSDDCWEKITAWIYGMGLCALFIVSTVFHIVSWKKSHLRLNLRELGPLASHMRWFIWLMAAGGTIYVFLYHEKYKVVELFFYLTMGFSPALVVTSMPHPVHRCGGANQGVKCRMNLAGGSGVRSSGGSRDNTGGPKRECPGPETPAHLPLSSHSGFGAGRTGCRSLSRAYKFGTDPLLCHLLQHVLKVLMPARSPATTSSVTPPRTRQHSHAVTRLKVV